MPRIGRPIELTPEVQDAVIRHLNTGNFLETAAPLAGVDIRTARWWMARGIKALKKLRKHGTEPTENEEAYIAFSQAVKEAYARNEARHATNITLVAVGRPGSETITETTAPDGTVTRTIQRTEGMTPQWTASAWWLERTNYKRWGRKERHELTGKNGKDLIPFETIREILDESQDPAPSE